MINFVTGEALQQIADISFCTNSNDVLDSSIKLVRIADFNVAEIKNYKKIFVYTHDILPFLKKFYFHLGNDTTLITHNSDNCIDDRFLEILDTDRIKKWYTQNLYTRHNKLFSLPIGIANKQWPHGNQAVLNKIKQLRLPKKTIVYKNFKLHTNYNKRYSVDYITSQNGIYMDTDRGYEEYLTKVAEARFVLSPPGNGKDCHRIWECLALGAVPVVENHICFEQFKHLPILFIDDWKIVTPAFLKKNDLTVTSDPPEIMIDYWKKII